MDVMETAWDDVKMMRRGRFVPKCEVSLSVHCSGALATEKHSGLRSLFTLCLHILFVPIREEKMKKKKYIIWIKIFNKMHFICCLFQVLSFISQAIYLLLSIVGPSQYSHLQYLRVFIAKCLLRPSSRESLSEFTGM